MASDSIALSYHDSLLKNQDVELLNPPNWLNDKIIGFYFEYLEREVFLKDHNKVCFITPDVTQFIKLYTGPELGIFLEPLHLGGKEVIALAINSSSSKTAAGGAHWSTLVYMRYTNAFEHYDSSASHNNTEALKCAQNLTEFLKADEKPEFKIIHDCPQQENGYDCGVYCVMFAEHATGRRLMCVTDSSIAPVDQPLQTVIHRESVTEWRKNTLELINRLKKVHSL